MRILIYGITGMLGSTLFRFLSNDPALTVFGTVRNQERLQHFTKDQASSILDSVAVENYGSIIRAFYQTKPDVVINCIGLIKQLPSAQIPLNAITVNAQFPHQLSQICKLNECRLIQVSTDCVFSGKKGNYFEADQPDPLDLYGLSKLLGEVNEKHALTIRTSMIGHELNHRHSLLEWFLSQQKSVLGFSKAIFSGLTTTELAKVIKLLCYNHALHGIYHVAAEPINKYDLLDMIANVYQKQITVNNDDSVTIDRSLNADKFQQATGYTAPNWASMIKCMYHFECERQDSLNSILTA